MAGKISKSIGVIYKASFCLPTSSLLTLYYSLVYPYLVYCVSVWGSTHPSNLKHILVLQKKVIRIISGRAFDAHTEPIFKQLKILKLCDIFRFQVGKIMFSFQENWRLLIAFNNLFMIRSQLHSYNTRNSSSFYTFSCRTNIRQFAIGTQGPRLFNSLNSEICNAANISLFKSKLKTFLLNWLFLLFLKSCSVLC